MGMKTKAVADGKPELAGVTDTQGGPGWNAEQDPAESSIPVEREELPGELDPLSNEYGWIKELPPDTLTRRAGRRSVTWWFQFAVGFFAICLTIPATYRALIRHTEQRNILRQHSEYPQPAVSSQLAANPLRRFTGLSEAVPYQLRSQSLQRSEQAEISTPPRQSNTHRWQPDDDESASPPTHHISFTEIYVPIPTPPLGLPTSRSQILHGLRPITLGTNSMRDYVSSLKDADHILRWLWIGASEKAKVAFSRNYIPRRRGDPPPLFPLDGVQSLIYTLVKGFKQVENSPFPEERHMYVKQVIIVSTVTLAAASRLVFLRELEKLCDETGVGSELLDRDEETLPTEEYLNGDPDVVDFSEFARMLEDQIMPIADVQGVTAGKTIPRVLAQRLADTVLANAMQQESNAYVHWLYEVLLQALPNVTTVALPFDEHFSLAVLERKVEQQQRRGILAMLSTKTVDSWIRSWSTPGIMSRLSFYTTRANDRLNAWRRENGSLSRGKFFATAVRLL